MDAARRPIREIVRNRFCDGFKAGAVGHCSELIAWCCADLDGETIARIGYPRRGWSHRFSERRKRGCRNGVDPPSRNGPAGVCLSH